MAIRGDVFSLNYTPTFTSHGLPGLRWFHGPPGLRWHAMDPPDYAGMPWITRITLVSWSPRITLACHGFPGLRWHAMEYPDYAGVMESQDL